MSKFKYMFAFGLIAISNLAVAQTSEQLISDKVLVKCYVELLGGKRVIYKLTVDNEDIIPSLVSRLPGSEVRAAGVVDKAKIYKALQCIKNEVDFLDGRARVLEEKQVR